MLKRYNLRIVYFCVAWALHCILCVHFFFYYILFFYEEYVKITCEQYKETVQSLDNKISYKQYEISAELSFILNL